MIFRWCALGNTRSYHKARVEVVFSQRLPLTKVFFLAPFVLLACGSRPSPATTRVGTLKSDRPLNNHHRPFKDCRAQFDRHSADELLAKALPLNDGYKTLTTMHRVSLELNQAEGRLLHYHFRGALAIKRPGTFRLQILGTMGLKLADIRSALGRYQTLFLARKLKKSPLFLKVIPSIVEDIRGIYRLQPELLSARKTLSLSKDVPPEAPCQFAVSFYRKNRRVSTLDILATTFAIVGNKLQDDAQSFCQIRFGAWTKQGKYLIPKQIIVKRTRPFVYQLKILVESIQMNVNLDPEMFSERF